MIIFVGPFRCLAISKSASPSLIGIPIVKIRSVEQDHHVRVLLEATALAKIRKHRPLVRALLRAMAEGDVERYYRLRDFRAHPSNSTSAPSKRIASAVCTSTSATCVSTIGTL